MPGRTQTGTDVCFAGFPANLREQTERLLIVFGAKAHQWRSDLGIELRYQSWGFQFHTVPTENLIRQKR